MKQAWQCTPGKVIFWNLLSLCTIAGMFCLEVSILAFLLQENYASGLETLAHTFTVSGIFIGLDILLKVISVLLLLKYINLNMLPVCTIMVFAETFFFLKFPSVFSLFVPSVWLGELSIGFFFFFFFFCFLDHMVVW